MWVCGSTSAVGHGVVGPRSIVGFLASRPYSGISMVTRRVNISRGSVHYELEDVITRKRVAAEGVGNYLCCSTGPRLPFNVGPGSVLFGALLTGIGPLEKTIT